MKLLSNVWCWFVAFALSVVCSCVVVAVLGAIVRVIAWAFMAGWRIGR